VDFRSQVRPRSKLVWSEPIPAPSTRLEFWVSGESAWLVLRQLTSWILRGSIYFLWFLSLGFPTSSFPVSSLLDDFFDIVFHSPCMLTFTAIPFGLWGARFAKKEDLFLALELKEFENIELRRINFYFPIWSFKCLKCASAIHPVPTSLRRARLFWWRWHQSGDVCLRSSNFNSLCGIEDQFIMDRRIIFDFQLLLFHHSWTWNSWRLWSDRSDPWMGCVVGNFAREAPHVHIWLLISRR